MGRDAWGHGLPQTSSHRTPDWVAGQGLLNMFEAGLLTQLQKVVTRETCPAFVAGVVGTVPAVPSVMCEERCHDHTWGPGLR